MNIVVIGNVEFTQKMLETLVSSSAVVMGVVTGIDAGINADHADLIPFCQQNKIDVLQTNDVNDDETIRWIDEKQPDVLLCLGWSRLIKQPLLSLAKFGVVGYHPAALPKNRGRHPLIWALVLGLKETASTFFLMDEGADSGDILSQQPIAIEEKDNASSLYEKMVKTAQKQLSELISQLKQGTHRSVPQDHLKANNWRKRGKLDGRIDWRMSARSVHNLIRALSKPYPGAHFDWQGDEYKVWKSRPIDLANVNNIEPGKILSTEGDSLVVKCMDQCIELRQITPMPKVEVGDYL